MVWSPNIERCAWVERIAWRAGVSVSRGRAFPVVWLMMSMPDRYDTPTTTFSTGFLRCVLYVDGIGSQATAISGSRLLTRFAAES